MRLITPNNITRGKPPTTPLSTTPSKNVGNSMWQLSNEVLIVCLVKYLS